MPSSQLQEQILIVNALEKFIFEKIRSTPFLGSHKSILMASNEEDLRKAIYTLHDEGLFRESEEDKIGYTDLMVDGAPSPHQSDTTLRWLIDRLRS